MIFSSYKPFFHTLTALLLFFGGGPSFASVEGDLGTIINLLTSIQGSVHLVPDIESYLPEMMDDIRDRASEQQLENVASILTNIRVKTDNINSYLSTHQLPELQNISTLINGFNPKLDGVNTKLDNINKAVTNFNKSVDSNLTKTVDRLDAVTNLLCQIAEYQVNLTNLAFNANLTNNLVYLPLLTNSFAGTTEILTNMLQTLAFGTLSNGGNLNGMNYDQVETSIENESFLQNYGLQPYFGLTLFADIPYWKIPQSYTTAKWGQENNIGWGVRSGIRDLSRCFWNISGRNSTFSSNLQLMFTHIAAGKEYLYGTRDMTEAITNINAFVMSNAITKVDRAAANFVDIEEVQGETKTTYRPSVFAGYNSMASNDTVSAGSKIDENDKEIKQWDEEEIEDEEVSSVESYLDDLAGSLNTTMFDGITGSLAPKVGLAEDGVSFFGDKGVELKYNITPSIGQAQVPETYLEFKLTDEARQKRDDILDIALNLIKVLGSCYVIFVATSTYLSDPVYGPGSLYGPV